MDDPHPERTLFLRDVAYWAVYGLLAVAMWGAAIAVPVAIALSAAGVMSGEAALALALPGILLVGASFVIAWRQRRLERQR